MKKLLVAISFLTLFMVAHATVKEVAIEYLTAEQVSPENDGLFGEVNPEQWQLYGGKELQTVNGLNLYDFHARWQDYATCWFTTQDPLAEKYYALSPYNYCAGNPIMLIDPTGMESLFAKWWSDNKMNMRFMGVVKAVGGALEATIGAVGLATTTPTIVGAAISGETLAHGCDVMTSGINQVVTGEANSSITSQMIQTAGVSTDIAETIDTSLGIVLSAGVNTSFNISKTACSTSSKNHIENITTRLNDIAKQAVKDVGVGSGHVYGSKVHSAFKNKAGGISSGGYTVQTEVSFKNGIEVNYGTKGSVRIDAGIYNSDNKLVQTYELKTGNARLTQTQIDKIAHHTKNYSPIILIKP